VAPKIFEPEFPLEKFDQYVDNPIYSMKNADEMWGRAIGPGYKEFGESLILGGEFYIAQSQADEFFMTMEEEAKIAQKRKEFWYNMAATTLGSLPVIPLRGDLKRLIQTKVRKEKAQYLQDKRTGKGKATSGGEEAGEMPEFQEKDYELINE
jgi:hypothetical protein